MYFAKRQLLSPKVVCSYFSDELTEGEELRYYMSLDCSEGFGEYLQPKYPFHQFFFQNFIYQFPVKIHNTQQHALRLEGGMVPVWYIFFMLVVLILISSFYFFKLSSDKEYIVLVVASLRHNKGFPLCRCTNHQVLVPNYATSESLMFVSTNKVILRTNLSL